jgi:hypothetical protein
LTDLWELSWGKSRILRSWLATLWDHSENHTAVQSIYTLRIYTKVSQGCHITFRMISQYSKKLLLPSNPHHHLVCNAKCLDRP